MQSDFENDHFEQTYGNFSLSLHHASDRSAIFLTVLAGRTGKTLPTLKGPGFESQQL